MHSRWYSFLNSTTQKYFNDGPRSYFEFEYHNKKIILIGEKHWSDANGSMTNLAAMQYIEVLNQYIENNSKHHKKTKILIEKDTIAKSNSEHKGRMGFIECIARLDQNSDVEIIAADNRSDNLASFLLFLEKLDGLANQIKEKIKLRTKHTPEIAPCFNNKESISALNELAEVYSSFDSKNNISVDSLEDEIKHQLDTMQDLLNKNERHTPLAIFISECYLTLCSVFLNDFEELKKINSQLDKNDSEHKTLHKTCIDMMLYKGDFSPVYQWDTVIISCLGPIFESHLANELWNELHQQSSTDAIVIITGYAHTKVLAEFIKTFANLVQKIAIDNDKYQSITPKKLGFCLAKTRIVQNHQCTII